MSYEEARDAYLAHVFDPPGWCCKRKKWLTYWTVILCPRARALLDIVENKIG